MDGHLVTAIADRPAILRTGLVEDRDFTVIDTRAMEERIARMARILGGGRGRGWTTAMALYAFMYPQFEREVWRRFKDRIRRGEFQIVHRLMPLSPTVPSLLAGRCRRSGVPYVLGPLNGGLPWPKHFHRVRMQEREWLSYVRWAYRLHPGYWATRREAAAIIIGSKATWDQMPRRYHNKCVYVPENGLDAERFPQTRARDVSRPIRLVYIGRLVPYKGADMALEAAIPYLRDGTVVLHIVGAGYLRETLERILQREGIAARVVFLGIVPHRQISSILAESDILIFPSIREFGGAVVLEAMAVGVVPMIVDYGGPRELATESTGFLITLGERGEIVARLCAALSQVIADPSIIDRKSEAAILRRGDDSPGRPRPSRSGRSTAGSSVNGPTSRTSPSRCRNSALSRRTTPKPEEHGG